MTVLAKLWKDQTHEFNPVQKTVLAIILLFIFATSAMALGLVYLELMK